MLLGTCGTDTEDNSNDDDNTTVTPPVVVTGGNVEVSLNPASAKSANLPSGAQ